MPARVPRWAPFLNATNGSGINSWTLTLKGAYFISQAAANIMVKQGGGKIINIASVDGYNPEPGLSIYSISKAGIRMLTKAFASELISVITFR